MKGESGGGKSTSTYGRIYAVVRRVPRGKVATYGQVAVLAGMRGHARQVGYALHSLPRGSLVPWHRVMNAKGEISLRKSAGGDLTQRILLEQEGIAFDLRGRVSLEKFGWRARTGSEIRTGASRARSN